MRYSSTPKTYPIIKHEINKKQFDFIVSNFEKIIRDIYNVVKNYYAPAGNLHFIDLYYNKNYSTPLDF